MNKKNVTECHGLYGGDLVEDFVAFDQDDKRVQLSELIKENKAVIIFYRGQWCPVCIPHLKKLQDGLNEIKKLGVSVLIITPENQENINKTILKTNINVPIIHDEDYKLMKAFDVAFVPSKGLKMIYNILLRANLKKTQSDESETLPIPATFIVDRYSRVSWRQFDRNYHNRASVEDLLTELNSDLDES